MRHSWLGHWRLYLDVTVQHQFSVTGSLSLSALLIKALAALALFLGASNHAAVPALEHMRFQRLLVDDGSAERITLGVMQDIVQDRDGFMWFASGSGVARYDSQEYRFYYANKDDPDSLSSDFVTNLLIDHAGMLWLATSNGLNRYNPERDNFTVYLHDPENRKSLGASYISALAEDAKGNIYAATNKGLSVLNPERTEFHSYRPEPGDPQGLIPRELRSVLVDSQQRVWLGSTGSGLYQYHPADGTFSHWPVDVPPSVADGVNSIKYIAEDHLGQLWLSTHGGGLLRLDPEQRSFTHYAHDPQDPYSIGSNTLRDILLDSHHQLWIATDHAGLARYDWEKDRFEHIGHDLYDQSSLSSNQLRALYEDPQGNLWTGNFPGGVNFYDRSKAAFTILNHQPSKPNSLTHDGVLSIYGDNNGIVWIGTEGGLNAYNPTTRAIKHYLHDPNDSHSLRFNTISTITEDRDSTLWVGSWSGGLHRFQRESERFVSYMPESDNPYSLGSEFVWQIAVDQENQLWVANTEGVGLHRFSPSTGHFTRYAHVPDNQNSLSYDQVRALIVDHENKVWAGTPLGLDYFDPVTERFTRFRHKPTDPASLSASNVTALFEDSRQRVWVGTDDGQVNIYDRAAGSFIQLNHRHGLPRVRVASILEDQGGQIWMGTSNGIARVDPQHLSVRMYSSSDGLAGNNHNRNAAYIDSEGTLYFGSTRGVSIFHPDRLPKDSPAPKVVITELRLANQAAKPARHPDVLARAIEKSDQVHLNHRHTTVALSFSALSYRSSYRNQYAYKLEGFDTQWNEAGSSRTATYTNLNPGRYVFKVRAANGQGVWSLAPTELALTVTPPPWRTSWAYVLYGLAGLALVSLIIHLKAKRLELDKERAVNARLLNLDRIKDSFLANTSHELRTPLNGIIGLAEASLDDTKTSIDPETANNLNLIAASGRRLSSLINDILDHSKLTDNTLELNKKPVDLHSTVLQVFSLLRPLAYEKGIALQNQVPQSGPAVWADPNRLQQILINLVGNGIKYSDGGQLTVRSSVSGMDLRIVVLDSGKGIQAKDLEAVFQPFKQLDGDDNRAQGGTGLGLAITKQLVELHKGKIWVESVPKQGSQFIFTMPLVEQGAVSLPSETTPESGLDEQAIKVGPKTQLSSTPPQLSSVLPPLSFASKFRVLIVDDDPINRLVLSSILTLHKYQVLEAGNGEQAVEIVLSGQRVDLVLLDVMMPKVSGYEACKMMRQKFPIEHLPILFLTAKRAEDELLRAFAAGGNEILCKPVERYELLAKVRNYLQLLDAYRRNTECGQRQVTS